MNQSTNQLTAYVVDDSSSSLSESLVTLALVLGARVELEDDVVVWPSVKSSLPKSEMDARPSPSIGNESTSSVMSFEMDSRLTLMLMLARSC